MEQLEDVALLGGPKVAAELALLPPDWKWKSGAPGGWVILTIDVPGEGQARADLGPNPHPETVVEFIRAVAENHLYALDISLAETPELWARRYAKSFVASDVLEEVVSLQGVVDPDDSLATVAQNGRAHSYALHMREGNIRRFSRCVPKGGGSFELRH